MIACPSLACLAIVLTAAGSMPATPKSIEGGSLVTSSIMCGPHFCSMRITEDVRKFAAEQKLSEDQALKAGLERKAKEFVEKGLRNLREDLML